MADRAAGAFALQQTLPISVSERDTPLATMERQMKMNATMTGDTETSGTRFFTWAILTVVAGLLIAVTTDFTNERNMTTTAAAHAATVTHTVEKSAPAHAS